MAKRKISSAAEVKAALEKPLSETPYALTGKYKKVSSKTNATRNFWIWVIVIIIIVIWLYNNGNENNIDFNTPVNSSISNDSDKITINEAIAVVMVVKPYVTNHLKAPVTAQFPDDHDMYSQVSKTSYGYRISSYVDSQNGFGALIRTYYTCEVGPVGDQLRVTDLKFDSNGN
jgi:hypothetical protein